MRMFNFNNGNNPLYTTQRGLLLAVKWLFDLLVFSPLVLTGYFAAKLMLDDGANGLLWLFMVLLIAILIWIGIQALKYLMIHLKAMHNLLWLPLFAIIVIATCLMPAYFAYKPINYIVMSLHGKPFVSKFIDGAFMFYVYLRYNFFKRH